MSISNPMKIKSQYEKNENIYTKNSQKIILYKFYLGIILNKYTTCLISFATKIYDKGKEISLFRLVYIFFFVFVILKGNFK